MFKNVVLVLGLLLSTAAAASEGGDTLQSGADVTDRASLQRGAKYYMSYCAGCHSLQYLRYSRMQQDLGLTEAEVQSQLNLTGAKIGDPVGVAMAPADSAKWFGKTPPDLSLIARVRGNDWIYTYLKSFYLDETRPLGWNNHLFANASMPNPLWELQGLQHAEYGPLDSKTGERPVKKLVIGQAGSVTPAQYDGVVRDITAFLEYAGEPAVLKREGLGVWVLLFLAFFTFMAWLLKKEYWKDVH